MSVHVMVIFSLICSSLPEEWCTFANPNLKIMEDYIKKAADAFLVERPYGMRVDYRKGGYVLFNRNLNVLGNKERARLEELPLEDFDVDEIPLEGEIIKEHAGFTDVFFGNHKGTCGFYRRVFLFGLYQPLCRVCAGSEEAQGLQSIYVPVGYGTEHEVVKS